MTQIDVMKNVSHKTSRTIYMITDMTALIITLSFESIEINCVYAT